jgi:hypothetical protein
MKHAPPSSSTDVLLPGLFSRSTSAPCAQTPHLSEYSTYTTSRLRRRRLSARQSRHPLCGTESHFGKDRRTVPAVISLSHMCPNMVRLFKRVRRSMMRRSLRILKWDVYTQLQLSATTFKLFHQCDQRGHERYGKERLEDELCLKEHSESVSRVHRMHRII